MTVTTFLLATADVPLLYAFLTRGTPPTWPARSNVARALSVVRGECYIDDDASDSGRYPAVYGDGGVYGETHCATYTIGGAVSAAVLANIAAMGMVFQAYIYDAAGEYAEYTGPDVSRSAAFEGAVESWTLAWGDVLDPDVTSLRSFRALWEITVAVTLGVPNVAPFKAGSLAERWRTALEEHNTPEPMVVKVTDLYGNQWTGPVPELAEGCDVAAVMADLRLGAGSLQVGERTVTARAVLAIMAGGSVRVIWTAPVEVRS